MTAPLPAAFLTPPLTHRGYHDAAAGRPENSRAAVRAAIDAGYGIEIDVQLSADGEAMVFHDYDLGRLTGRRGPVQGLTAQELGRIPLLHDTEGIPTLRQILDLVAGRVALLIEIKDQDGAMGPDVGVLETAVVAALHSYTGPVAVMSFNPHSAVKVAEIAPDLSVGLTTCAYKLQDWRLLPASTRKSLRAISDFDRVGARFISHDARDLDRPRVSELKAAGVPVLCWTVRSAEAEALARRVADNITFEGYPARRPG